MPTSSRLIPITGIRSSSLLTFWIYRAATPDSLSGISNADFIAADSYNGNPIFFAADVLDISSGNTGAVGARVPEPGSMALLGTGLSGLALLRRRSQARAKAS